MYVSHFIIQETQKIFFLKFRRAHAEHSNISVQNSETENLWLAL